MTSDPLFLLVDVLAVFRLTRLITKDSLLNGPRFWILQRWPSELTQYPDAIVNKRLTIHGEAHGEVLGRSVFMSTQTDDDGDPIWLPDRTHKWAELLECSWCASTYVAAGVLMLESWWDWWRYPALVLAFSALAGLMFTHWDNT